MLKKILLALLLSSQLLPAQHSIKGSMQPAKEYTWIALYKLQGAKQDYITNGTVENGNFNLSIPKEETPGIYRLVYDLEEQLFVDLIYNKEDIFLNFHPKLPNKIIKFQQSYENNIFQNYLKAITGQQQKLDSLQVDYFSLPRPLIKMVYYKEHADLLALQKQYETLAEGKLAGHFIKASRRYNSPEPISKPEAYLDSLKKHYFDAIDFNKKELLNSAFINDKVNEFIFYINSSQDKEKKDLLWKEAVNTVLTKIGDNMTLLKDIQEGLLYTFAQQEEIGMVNFLLNHYLQLPKELQDVPFINDIKGSLRTAIGVKAPNIKWQDDNQEKDLYNLEGHQIYLLVFWSSTCPHCLIEVPQLHTYLEDKPEVKVLAVGLEDQTSKAGWETQIDSLGRFTHVFADEKWESKAARDYGVNATPSYFILDKDKKVLAKPENVESLKLMFKED